LNPLTKVFAVLVALTQIGLVAVVVPFVAKQQNLQERLVGTETQLKSAQGRAALAEAEASAVRTNAEGALASAQQQVASRDVRITTLENQLRDAERRRQEAEQQNATNSASLRVATEANVTLEGINQRNQTAIAAASTRNHELEIQVAQLSNTIFDVGYERDRLASQVRRLNEDVIATRRELALAQDTVAQQNTLLGQVGLTSGLEMVVAPNRIDAQIEAVRDVAGGNLLVQLNVGENDQVREGMVFTVRRGDTYLGRVRVVNVDVAASVAEVISSEGVIQAGDGAFILGYSR
jgi:hypothetical protein